MPGSKRRLKKLFSPNSSPSPSSTTVQSGSFSSFHPNTQTNGDSLASSSQATEHHRSGSNSHSIFHMPHLGGGHRKSDSSPSKSSAVNPSSLHPSDSMVSSSSIMSDSGNYLTDKELNNEAVLGEMEERREFIGNGGGRTTDGVGELSTSPVPIPVMAPLGESVAAPPVLDHGSGAIQAPAPQQLTAEELMFVDGGGGGEGGKKKSSKQRFDERQARKREQLLSSAPPNDPAWTKQLERERLEEIQVVSNACDVLGRDLYEIEPDGHCMFNAVADQLCQIGLIPAHQATNPFLTRRTASQYMLAHQDDFLPFLPSITGEDSAGATADGTLTTKEFHKYCALVAETGEWGGEPEIQALSRVFSIPIHVIQRGPPTIVSHGGLDDSFGGALTFEQSAAQGDRIVRITYHRRMYGLGEHYNSLRKAI